MKALIFMSLLSPLIWAPDGFEAKKATLVDIFRFKVLTILYVSSFARQHFQINMDDTSSKNSWTSEYFFVVRIVFKTLGMFMINTYTRH